MVRRVRFACLSTSLAVFAAAGFTDPARARQQPVVRSSPERIPPSTEIPPEAHGPLRLLPVFLPTSTTRTYIYFAFETDIPQDWMEHPAVPMMEHDLSYEVRAIDQRTMKTAFQKLDHLAVQLSRSLLPGSVRFDRPTLQIETGFELPPGRYEFRAAVEGKGLPKRDTTSVTTDVPDLSSAPIALGSLVLGYAGGPRVPIAPFRSAGIARAARLPVVPTLDRTFDRADNVRLYTEAVRKDLFALMDVTIEFINEGGTVVQSRVERRAAGEATTVDVRVPLDGMPAGTYRLRVVAKSGATTADREISIVVK